MSFFGAHSAVATTACGRVKLLRTMKGEASVMADVAAAITTIVALLCVAIGAVAMAADLAARLLLPELDRAFDLLAGGGLLAGHRQDDTDLHGLALRLSKSGTQRGERQGGPLCRLRIIIFVFD